MDSVPDATEEDAQLFPKYLATIHKWMQGQGRKEATVKSYVRQLSTLFSEDGKSPSGMASEAYFDVTKASMKNKTGNGQRSAAVKHWMQFWNAHAGGKLEEPGDVKMYQVTLPARQTEERPATTLEPETAEERRLHHLLELPEAGWRVSARRRASGNLVCAVSPGGTAYKTREKIDERLGRASRDAFDPSLTLLDLLNMPEDAPTKKRRLELEKARENEGEKEKQKEKETETEKDKEKETETEKVKDNEKETGHEKDDEKEKAKVKVTAKEEEKVATERGDKGKERSQEGNEKGKRKVKAREKKETVEGVKDVLGGKNKDKVLPNLVKAEEESLAGGRSLRRRLSRESRGEQSGEASSSSSSSSDAIDEVDAAQTHGSAPRLNRAQIPNGKGGAVGSAQAMAPGSAGGDSDSDSSDSSSSSRSATQRTVPPGDGKAKAGVPMTRPKPPQGPPPADLLAKDVKKNPPPPPGPPPPKLLAARLAKPAPTLSSGSPNSSAESAVTVFERRISEQLEQVPVGPERYQKLEQIYKAVHGRSSTLKFAPGELDAVFQRLRDRIEKPASEEPPPAGIPGGDAALETDVAAPRTPSDFGGVAEAFDEPYRNPASPGPKHRELPPPARSCLRGSRLGPSALASRRRITFGQERPVEVVPILNWRSAGEMLWFANPGQQVCCDRCESIGSQMSGQLSGARGRSQFSQPEFLCHSCYRNMGQLQMEQD